MFWTHSLESRCTVADVVTEYILRLCVNSGF